MFRTDEHNNPTAFTTDIAKLGGLVEGTDYLQGEPFNGGNFVLHTAKLLGDPIVLTIKLIDKIGFYTNIAPHHQRWIYIAIPFHIWTALTHDQKRDVIGFMYQHEGGVTMRPLFPNYGKV